jgi:hypothetical protein
MRICKAGEGRRATMFSGSGKLARNSSTSAVPSNSVWGFTVSSRKPNSQNVGDLIFDRIETKSQLFRYVKCHCCRHNGFSSLILLIMAVDEWLLSRENIFLAQRRRDAEKRQKTKPMSARSAEGCSLRLRVFAREICFSPAALGTITVFCHDGCLHAGKGYLSYYEDSPGASPVCHKCAL